MLDFGDKTPSEKHGCSHAFCSYLGFGVSLIAENETPSHFGWDPMGHSSKAPGAPQTPLRAADL